MTISNHQCKNTSSLIERIFKTMQSVTPKQEKQFEPRAVSNLPPLPFATAKIRHPISWSPHSRRPHMVWELHSLDKGGTSSSPHDPTIDCRNTSWLWVASGDPVPPHLQCHHGQEPPDGSSSSLPRWTDFFPATSEIKFQIHHENLMNSLPLLSCCTFPLL